MERIQKEAEQCHKLLAENFQNYMLTCEDPDGPGVKEKIAQANAQWRVFCRRKNLRPEAFELIQTFCYGLVKEYTEAKQQPA